MYTYKACGSGDYMGRFSKIHNKGKLYRNFYQAIFNTSLSNSAIYHSTITAMKYK